MTDPTRLSVAKAGAAFRAGTLTAVALAQAQLDRIAALNPTIHAFTAVTPDQALAAATAADADFSAGIDRGPLQGIGFAVKDMVDLQGLPTTCGSHAHNPACAAADATAVAQLRAQGAVPLGKVATYEYALVGPSFDGPFPPAANPWNTAHITGGSSSGSAAAVASGMVRLAIGTDTGGSIRSPACYTGIVGLKPTMGAVSRSGVFPLSDALDHVGPLAACTADAALMMECWQPGTSARLGQPAQGMTIGYARDWFAADPATHPAVLVAMDAAMSALSQRGMQVNLIALPDYAETESAGITILQYQAFALHKDRLPLGRYGQQARETLLTGQHLTAQDFTRATATAARFAADMDAILSRHDAIATACVLSTAPPFAAFAANRAVWTAMRTLPFNMSGHPALALPTGFHHGLPMGLQLIGRNHQEATLCQIGHAYEMATDHAAQRPRL